MVNALSVWLELTIWRDDKEHNARFEHGDTVRHLTVVGPANGQKGSASTFMPSDQTFTHIELITKRWSTACASWLSLIPACGFC